MARPTKKSTEPFARTVLDLLDAREWSQRRLAKKAGMSAAYLNSVVNGREIPATETGWINLTVAMARALKIRPDHFAEYRLALARRQLDPAVVGLRQALRNLGEVA